MSIQIDCIRIANFRGLSNIEIHLPRVAVLVGINNSGKTSIIKAIQLAISDYYRFLTEEDFYIDENGNHKDKIVIDYRIIPINDDGEREKEFNEDWQREFGDKIQPDENNYVAIRTIASPDMMKGGFKIDRYFLKEWEDFNNWQKPEVKKEVFKDWFKSLSFVPIDSQRDIYSELKERKSFIRQVLSKIKYEKNDIDELEKKMSEINENIIASSDVLNILKENLNKLNESFDGHGGAELTPLPKKLRDLHKQFNVHFSDQKKNSFPMEYHGMGTRSWASMLTMLAFVKILEKNHKDETKPFFPIIAAEEPEAHLHPNAQRTLYNQLAESSGQIIISTHSPYLAGISELSNLRILTKINGDASVAYLNGLEPLEEKKLQREVMRLRGEILFAKAIVLFEGVTEEQVIPAMYEKFDNNGYKKGILFISVGGTGYSPFIKLAMNLHILCCIISDNDQNIKQKIENQIKKITIKNDIFLLNFLQQGNNFEAEIMKNLKDEIKNSLLILETKGNTHEQCINAKKAELNKLTDDEIIEKMRNSKAEYSSFLADEIMKSDKEAKNIIPKSIIGVFEKIKERLK
jgi:putative ATP-dependent endonuclease of OLD family